MRHDSRRPDLHADKKPNKDIDRVTVNGHAYIRRDPDGFGRFHDDGFTHDHADDCRCRIPVADQDADRDRPERL